jgi:hypothetical protein
MFNGDASPTMIRHNKKGPSSSLGVFSRATAKNGSSKHAMEYQTMECAAYCQIAPLEVSSASNCLRPRQETHRSMELTTMILPKSIGAKGAVEDVA